MKNKFISFAILIMILIAFFMPTYQNVFAVEENQQPIEFKGVEQPLEKIQRINEQSRLPRSVSATTIGAFAIANPSLYPFLLAGLAGLALGMVFVNIDEILDFGRAIKEKMTAEAWKTAVTSVISSNKINLTYEFKQALTQTANSSDISNWQYSGLYEGIDNKYLYTYGSIYMSMSGAAELWGGKYISLSGKVGGQPDYNDSSMPYHTAGNIYTPKITVEIWRSGGIPDYLKKYVKIYLRSAGWMGSDYPFTNVKSTARGIIGEITSEEIQGKGAYSKALEKIHVKTSDTQAISSYGLLANSNITVTLPDGTSQEVRGDDKEKNPNPLKGLGNLGLLFRDDQIAYAPTAEIPADRPIGANDVPNFLSNPETIDEDGQEVIKDLAAEQGGLDLEGENEEGNETGAPSNDILSLLKQVWLFCINTVSPGMGNIISILRNQKTISNFLVEKFNAVLAGIKGIPGAVKKDLDALWEDAGAVFSGLEDKIIELNAKAEKNFIGIVDGIDAGVKDLTGKLSGISENVAEKLRGVLDGIDAGVKDFSGALAGLKDAIGEKVSDMADAVGARIGDLSDAIAKGLDAVLENVRAIPNVITDILTWLRDFFVPDFAGIKERWGESVEKLKNKFKPILDLVDGFKNVFATRKSIYDIELDIFKNKVNPVPISLKPAIDVFKLFTNALCILLTLWRAYKRFVGEDEAIAT